MPTIADVAREAGVGIGTVSRVLNDSPVVSEGARQRVQAAMDRLGYRPSRAARAFGGRRTHTLELLVPLYARSFFLEILRGVEDALARAQYTVTIRTVEEADERDRVFEDCCVRSGSDGALIIWIVPTESFIQRVTAENFVAVLVNAVDPRLSGVAVNHDAAAERAVTYCVGLGHRRVALVDRLQDPFDAASPGMCWRGYQQALAAAGLAIPADYGRVADLSAAGGAAALDSLVALPESPTAVVVGSDIQAVGLIEAARRRGLRVPEDLSVVGYNDSEFAQFLGLTTVQVPLREMGRQAMEVLLTAIGDPAADPTTTYLPTELVVRKTCGPPGSSGPATGTRRAR